MSSIRMLKPEICPEICTDSRPATARPVPTIVPMIAFVSLLT